MLIELFLVLSMTKISLMPLLKIKECPFGESECADNYKAAFKEKIKKALNIGVV